MSLPFAVRAVQLDLARQMETVDFIRRYADFAAGVGFNTLVLYLEGRVRTATFPHRPPEHSYTLDDMDRVVRHAAGAGLEVVPVVSALGHAEQFVSGDALAHLSEEREGRTRFGGKGRSTFCLSLPETLDFLARYLDELARVFPGPHVHLGFDECWNLGYCPLCAERWRRDGLGALFSLHVRNARALCERLGKRMWMWDDMYEFWPAELDRTPRDILMCHWNYDDVVAPEGSQAHFRNRWRRDWLAEYERLGFEALVCPVPNLRNAVSLTDHARRRRVLGGLLTQWEMSSSFHEALAPAVAAVGRLWSRPDFEPEAALADGLRDALPGGAPPLLRAVRPLLAASGGPLAASAGPCLRGPLSRGEQADRAGLEGALAAFRHARATGAPTAREDVLDDLETAARIGAVGWALRELAPAVWDPRRPPQDAPRLRRLAAAAARELDELLPIRERHHRERRPGCHPSHHAAEGLRRARLFVDELLARLDREPAPDERWLVLRLCLPDWYGAPRLRVAAFFPGRAEPLELACGGLKQPPQLDGSHYTAQLPFSSGTAPEAVRFEASGYGGHGVAYVEAQGRDGVARPVRVRRASGRVRDPEAVLRDDSLFAWLGWTDILSAIHDPSLAEETAVLEVELG